tara:strand:+ start:403 stop:630 length:228 start_codon:yes stop_codon:yes gene_type:complete
MGPHCQINARTANWLQMFDRDRMIVLAGCRPPTLKLDTGQSNPDGTSHCCIIEESRRGEELVSFCAYALMRRGLQ